MSAAESFLAPDEAATSTSGTVDVSIAKAQLIDPQLTGVQPSNTVAQHEDEKARRTRAGAITPPWSAAALVQRWEESTALRPAVACMVANVDGHGHRFQKVFDPDAHDADEKIKTSILLERLRGMWSPRRPTRAPDLQVSQAEIETRKETIRQRIQLEEIWLNALFSACCPGSTFTQLRKKLRTDLEVTGAWYFELLRDESGDPASFEHLRSTQTFPRPVVCDKLGKPAHVPVKIAVRTTPILVDRVEVTRLFRTYVQLGLTSEVYFKEYGDPRLISANDGDAYDGELPRGHKPATEVVSHVLYHPLYVYGAPRAIAAVPTISGLHDSQVVNAVHFSANCIPRMAVLIHGGSLRDGAEEKIKSIIESHCKGVENYGSVLILQATPPANSPAGTRTTIELKPLKEAVPGDMLFQQYELQGSAVILSQFRIPKILIGWAEDNNRSTSDNALKFADEQVFQPERTDFDELMDSMLLQEGIQCWQFVTNSVVTRDPETTATIVDKLGRVVPINELLEHFVSDIASKQIPRIEEEWANMPWPLALAKLQAGASAAPKPATVGAAPAAKTIGGVPVAKNLDELAVLLEDARDHLFKNAEDIQRIEIMRGNQPRDIVLAVSGDTMRELTTAT